MFENNPTPLKEDFAKFANILLVGGV